MSFKSNATVSLAVIEYQAPNVWVERPRMETRGKNFNAKADMLNFNEGPFVFDRSKILITLFSKNGVFEQKGCPAS